MTSQQIEYVPTLAELKSFSKAAQKLYVTQPSLSQYIMNIERQLGVSLFDRSTTPIHLTSEGEAFVKSAVQIKAIEENLKNQLSDMANLNKGSLKIGATSFCAACLLSQSIAEFCKTFAGIEVSVAEDNAQRLLEMVHKGELDVFVGTGHFDTHAFHVEELAKQQLYLAVGEKNPINDALKDYCLTADDIAGQSMRFLTAPTVDLAVFKDENFILRGGNDLEEPAVSICGKKGFAPTATLTVRSEETLFSFVNAGFGVGFVSDTMIRFGNHKNHPCYYSVDSRLAENSISLCSRKNGYFTRAAKEYCLLLKRLVDIGTWRV